MTYFFLNKKIIVITNVFPVILITNQTKHVSCVDKCSKFYYISMKSWLQDNDIEIYSLYC